MKLRNRMQICSQDMGGYRSSKLNRIWNAMTRAYGIFGARRACERTSIGVTSHVGVLRDLEHTKVIMCTHTLTTQFSARGP
jgi:hypothetical protein